MTNATATKGKKGSVPGKTASTKVAVPDLTVETVAIPVYGTTDLIVHNFTEKSRQQIRDTQQQKAKQGRGKREPVEEFKGSQYLMPGVEFPKLKKGFGIGDTIPFKKDTFGVKASSFKNAAVGACRFVDGMKMTEARGAFFVLGDPETDLIPLEYEKLTMVEDIVRLPNGSADLRYRGYFHNWKAMLHIEYNPTVISLEQLVNLIAHAGFGSGVGDWRPGNNGNFGRFRVTEPEKD